MDKCKFAQALSKKEDFLSVRPLKIKIRYLYLRSFQDVILKEPQLKIQKSI